MHEKRSCWNQWFFSFSLNLFITEASSRRAATSARSASCHRPRKSVTPSWREEGTAGSTAPSSAHTSRLKGSQITFFLLASCLTPKAEAQPCRTMSKPCVVTPSGRYFTGNFHRSFFDSKGLLGFASQLLLSVISWVPSPNLGWPSYSENMWPSSFKNNVAKTQKPEENDCRDAKLL